MKPGASRRGGGGGRRLLLLLLLLFLLLGGGSSSSSSAAAAARRADPASRRSPCGLRLPHPARAAVGHRGVTWRLLPPDSASRTPSRATDVDAGARTLAAAAAYVTQGRPRLGRPGVASVEACRFLTPPSPGVRVLRPSGPAVVPRGTFPDPCDPRRALSPGRPRPGQTVARGPSPSTRRSSAFVLVRCVQGLAGPGAPGPRTRPPTAAPRAALSVALGCPLQQTVYQILFIYS
ncbi:uncharacterized protein AAEQ78_001842 [Lycaon pictus]